MDIKKLLTDQFNLLLTEPGYIIPEDIEIQIEEETGLYRDFCTDTEQYLDTQIEWMKFIMDYPLEF
jgi:hypothetical protein